MLARDSTVVNGNISWSVASEEALMCLEQFINDIRHDYEKLPHIPNLPKTHKKQRDLNPDGVNVVVHALRMAARDIQDVTTTKDLWKPKPEIVKKIAKALSDLADGIAAGNDSSSMEFPWIDDGTSLSKSYTFPTKTKFKRNKKKLKKKLDNPNKKHDRLSILRGLEPVAASFACEEVKGSTHNDHGPPSQIPQTKI